MTLRTPTRSLCGLACLAMGDRIGDGPSRGSSRSVQLDWVVVAVRSSLPAGRRSRAAPGPCARESVTDGEFCLGELACDVNQEVNVGNVGPPVDDRWSQRSLPCEGGRAGEHAPISA